MYLSLSRQVRFKTAIAKCGDDHCDNDDDDDDDNNNNNDLMMMMWWHRNMKRFIIDSQLAYFSSKNISVHVLFRNELMVFFQEQMDDFNV